MIAQLPRDAPLQLTGRKQNRLEIAEMTLVVKKSDLAVVADLFKPAESNG